jgi:hypothetical protein
METVARRLEGRMPLAIRVNLSSLDVRQGACEGITENVSTHGVRIVSSRPWRPDDRLNLRAFPGDFRARARVVYCKPVGRGEYAIGLQLLAAAGNWN